MNGKELLEVVLTIGERLTAYGAEIYRVEESISRICAAYGYTEADVFAIPPGIAVTVKDSNGTCITRSVSITGSDANLDRVGEYSRLCRRICAEKPSYDEIISETEKIENRPVYSRTVQLAGYLAVGFSFAFFFGGDPTAALFAAAAAGIVFFLTELSDKFGAGMFLTRVLCSSAAALFAYFICGKHFAEDRDTVIISALMTMVPGISITNCMRDFISGDMLAGLYTMTEAFTAAIGMAVGAGIVMAAF